MTGSVAADRSVDFDVDRLEALFAYADRIVFRHDVDYDPVCALRMAELEHEWEIRSTYHFLVVSPGYNAFAKPVREIINAIGALGHELAIHVDLELPRHAETPNAALHFETARQHRLLSIAYPIGRKVSFHAPPASVYWRDVAGFEHALAAHWQGRHISDSRGVFRQSPEELLETPGLVQLSLHPEWWFWPHAKADEWRVIEAAKP